MRLLQLEAFIAQEWVNCSPNRQPQAARRAARFGKPAELNFSHDF